MGQDHPSPCQSNSGSERQAAGQSLLSTQPATGAVTSGTSKMPLVASEPRHQQPRLLGALVSVIPHPPACPVAETEPQEQTESAAHPHSHPKPDQIGPDCEPPRLGISAAGLGSRQEKARKGGQKKVLQPPRWLGGSRRHGCTLAREWLLAGSGVTAEESGGSGAREGLGRLHQWLPEQLPREKLLWRPCLWYHRPWGRTGRRERVGVRVSGELAPRAGKLGPLQSGH